MQDNIPYRAGLYLRLSKDDDLDGESLSISTQRSILTDYCAANGYMVFGIQVGGIIRGDKSSPFGGVVPGVTIIEAGIVIEVIPSVTDGICVCNGGISGAGSNGAVACTYILPNLPPAVKKKPPSPLIGLGGIGLCIFLNFL